MARVYKICTAGAWAEAIDKGVFAGATIDLVDGFIHLSTGPQARETARLHFKTGDDLVLVAFDAAGLDGLKYEASRGGDLFPHVYGTIPASRALAVTALSRGADGVLVIPDAALAEDAA
jgi:uncharacterized protein (DUF952 family)